MRDVIPFPVLVNSKLSQPPSHFHVTPNSVLSHVESILPSPGCGGVHHYKPQDKSSRRSREGMDVGSIFLVVIQSSAR